MLETAPVLPVPLSMGCLIPKAKSTKTIPSLSQVFPHGPLLLEKLFGFSLTVCLVGSGQHGVPQFLGDKECGHA